VLGDKEVDEAVEHFTRERVPSLVPNVRGNFQVRLLGLHKGINNPGMAEIELRIVDPTSREVRHSFGSKTISVGKTVTLQGLESQINFLPEDLK